MIIYAPTNHETTAQKLCEPRNCSTQLLTSEFPFVQEDQAGNIDVEDLAEDCPKTSSHFKSCLPLNQPSSIFDVRPEFELNEREHIFINEQSKRQSEDKPCCIKILPGGQVKSREEESRVIEKDCSSSRGLNKFRKRAKSVIKGSWDICEDGFASAQLKRNIIMRSKSQDSSKADRSIICKGSRTRIVIRNLTQFLENDFDFSFLEEVDDSSVSISRELNASPIILGEAHSREDDEEHTLLGETNFEIFDAGYWLNRQRIRKPNVEQLSIANGKVETDQQRRLLEGSTFETSNDDGEISVESMIHSIPVSAEEC